MMMLKPFGLVAVLVLLMTACQSTPPPKPNPRGQLDGRIKVTVQHPNRGTGPGYLVRLYRDSLNYKANKSFLQGVTNDTGHVRLGPAPFGTIWVDCYVPGDSAWYDSLRTFIPIKADYSVTLKLKPHVPR